MGFGDLNVSMQMRDTIEKLVTNTIDKLRPAYRYVVVQTVDPASAKATVVMTGDTNAVTVSYGRTTPYVGCVVRVNGMGTDRYIEDVMSDGVVTVPAGADMNNYINPGTYAVNTNARALTILNLPVPPLPATNPDNAVNPKAVVPGGLMAQTNSATYWTVSRGVTVGGPSASPYGTTTLDVVTPIGSPLGSGYIAGVNNIDGLTTVYGARTVSLHVTTTTGAGFEYRGQSTGSWIAKPAGWQRISWDVPANTTAILEIRRIGGAAVQAGDVAWLTDYSSVPNPTAAGSIRAPSQGVFQVLTNPESQRVVQVFYQVSSTTATRTFQFQRLRGSTGTWGPWTLNQTPIPVQSESQQDALLKELGASRLSPVSFRRIDQRSAQSFFSLNGDTIGSDMAQYVSAANWTSTLQNGFTDYLNTYAPGAYRRTASGIVLLRGLVKCASTTATVGGSLIMTLPVGYRPAAQQMFMVNASMSATTRVDVLPDGRVVLNGYPAGSNIGYLSLAGIQFPVAEVAPNSAWTTLTLLNSFQHYAVATGDYTWPMCSYWVDPYGRYWFRGLGYRSSAPAGDTAVATLPASAAIGGQTHFASMSNSGLLSWHQISGSTPQLFWKSGGVGFFNMPTHPIVPDAALAAASTGWNSWANLGYVNGWANYGGSFPTGSVWEAPDGLMHVRGLLSSGTIGAQIAGLGVSYGQTPLGINIWSLDNVNTTAARIDVAATYFLSVAGTAGWHSLDGIVYLREN